MNANVINVTLLWREQHISALNHCFGLLYLIVIRSTLTVAQNSDFYTLYLFIARSILVYSGFYTENKM